MPLCRVKPTLSLDREVYWTGRHECWRTMTTRSRAKDNKPESAPRPAEERYSVALPPFVDPAVAAQAVAYVRSLTRT